MDLALSILITQNFSGSPIGRQLKFGVRRARETDQPAKIWNLENFRAGDKFHRPKTFGIFYEI